MRIRWVTSAKPVSLKPWPSRGCARTRGRRLAVTIGKRPQSLALSYRGAGVDVEAKSRMLEALAPAIAATHSDAVAAGLGAFAGGLRLPDGSGFLLATTDGAGTKTLLARQMGRGAGVGGGIVGHCAHDP